MSVTNPAYTLLVDGENLILPVKTITDHYDLTMTVRNKNMMSVHNTFIQAVDDNDVNTVKILIDIVNVNYQQLYYNNNGNIHALEFDGEAVAKSIKMVLTHYDQNCNYIEAGGILYNNGGVLKGPSCLRSVLVNLSKAYPYHEERLKPGVIKTDFKDWFNTLRFSIS